LPDTKFHTPRATRTSADLDSAYLEDLPPCLMTATSLLTYSGEKRRMNC
jgi:hypothetical protein